MRVYIETYGCTANQDDSNIMKSLLERAGAQIVDSAELADILIVNTCGVKHTTQEKIIYRIRQLKGMGKKLVVAGCLPASGKVEFPEAEGVLGTNPKDILLLLRKMEKGRAEIIRRSHEKAVVQKHPISPSTQAIQISTGCLSHCSFCFTKFSRGELRSIEPEKIVDMARKYVKAGIKEIWLTSQDAGCWGFDIGTRLPNLLDELIRIDGKFLIRIGMANPQHLRLFMNDLLDVMESDKIYKFLHVPVQSGSDKVLRDMKRGHTADDFRRISKKFRKRFPMSAVWTDIIVGFPTETEKDFEMTLELLKDVVPDHTNVSRFSARPGTEAKSLKQLPSSAVKERTRRASALVSRLNFTRNQSWIGWKGEVLVNEYKKERSNWVGRNFAYKPVILRGSHSFGQFKEVEIVDAIETGLIAG